MQTYAERELLPLGFEFFRKLYADEEKTKLAAVILTIGNLKLQFDCVCSDYPGITAAGCSLHHPDDISEISLPIEEAKLVASALSADSQGVT